MTGTFIQLLGYSLVGALGTLVQYSVLVVGVAVFGAAPVVASTVGALLGAMTNYALNYRFTFRSRQRHATTSTKFALVAGASVFVNSLVLELAIRRFGLHYIAAQLVATGVVLIFGFIANRTWTFKKEPHGRPSA